MTVFVQLVGAMFLGALLGCSPTFDWREVSPQASGLAALFPCRPDEHSRKIVLAEAPVDMDMLVCSAGGATFALSFVDVGDAVRVTPTLAALRAAAVTHLGDAQPRIEPLEIKGMTPNPESVRVSFGGKLPDGAVLQQRSLFFSRGLRVYQASVVGAKPAAEAVDTFFAGLRFPP